MTKKLLMKRWFMIVLGAGMALSLVGCGAQEDVDFARGVMNSLIAGHYTARHHIDWASFVALENNLGPRYKALGNDKEKRDFECAFIDNFKTGFKNKNAAGKSFVRWRVFNDADPKVTYVAADNASGSGTLVFTVARQAGQRKLTAIRVIHVTDRVKFQEIEKEQRHVLQGPQAQ